MAERDLATDAHVLIFDRTPLARLISCAAVFGSAAIFFDYLSHGLDEIELLPMTGIALLVLGTFAAAIVQYCDHIYIGDEGVMYENSVLKLIGRRGRWMHFEDMVEVREMRHKVLVLLARDGRRLLVDSIAPPRTRNEWRARFALTRSDRAQGGSYLGYVIARNEILRRAPQAIRTGTLAASLDEA